MSATGWMLLAVANVPVYFGLGWLFFKDLDDFFGAIRFGFTPDVISALQGEFWNDRWASFKLGLWILCCAGSVIGEAQLLGKGLF